MSEAEDQEGDCLDFLGGQNPNTGPLNTGQFGMSQMQRGSTGMAVVPRLSVEGAEENEKLSKREEEGEFLKILLEKTMKAPNVEDIDEETSE